MFRASLRLFGSVLVFGTPLVLCGSAALAAERVVYAPSGAVELHLNENLLARIGLAVRESGGDRGTSVSDRSVRLELADGESVYAGLDGGSVTALSTDHLVTADGVTFDSRNGSFTVADFVLVGEQFSYSADADWARLRGELPALELTSVRAAFSQQSGELLIPALSVRISKALAAQLGDASLSGQSVGTAVVRAAVSAGAIDQSAPISSPELARGDGASAGTPVGDMQFCEMYGLRQFGNTETHVGLALATTSWNVGDADLEWFALPNESHPFIGQNLFRLENDRFMQIGQSWVKHGFFALGDVQCSLPGLPNCAYESGHGTGSYLGQGCTDTYTAPLNADQFGLGPRAEINPWTGAYDFQTSIMNGGPGAADSVERRIRVSMDDLRDDFHPDAEYFYEGYYIVRQDVNHMNNVAWKPVTPVQESPTPRTWSFDSTGASVAPFRSFAVEEAWPGADVRVFAEQLPVDEVNGNDGRVLVASKAIQVDDATWRYEYAVYNVDLARHVAEFSISVPDGAFVSAPGSHAPNHIEEFAGYSNDAWSVSQTATSVSWSTPDNPIRWGTLHNFWFEVNAPPSTIGEATITTFDEGVSFSGTITGPSLTPLVCAPTAAPSPEAVAVAKSRYVAVIPPDIVEATALRVELVSIDGGGAAMNGEYRWVGPAAEYPDGHGGTFSAAQLQCEPHYQKWGGTTVNVYGEEIRPFSSYSVQAISGNCAGAVDVEQNYSGAAAFSIGKYGDIVEPFDGDAPVAQPDINDILAVVDEFLGSTAVSHVQTQMQPAVPDPSQEVAILDVLSVVDSFLGQPYPFDAPTSCP